MQDNIGKGADLEPLDKNLELTPAGGESALDLTSNPFGFEEKSSTGSKEWPSIEKLAAHHFRGGRRSRGRHFRGGIL